MPLSSKPPPRWKTMCMGQGARSIMSHPLATSTSPVGYSATHEKRVHCLRIGRAHFKLCSARLFGAPVLKTEFQQALKVLSHYFKFSTKYKTRFDFIINQSNIGLLVATTLSSYCLQFPFRVKKRPSNEVVVECKTILVKRVSKEDHESKEDPPNQGVFYDLQCLIIRSVAKDSKRFLACHTSDQMDNLPTGYGRVYRIEPRKVDCRELIRETTSLEVDVPLEVGPNLRLYIMY
ncbi:hypothetical protein H6P81_017017 [Aristolochia fimbriata]|uniref:Uncharacterized protein n=1 Tax=Aristolochia fimbriata TaxID=158543 RepID=A0AAV7DY16_ARIFI|nr:hypothetical protein H6P81_017017 [Aristolochia fimbriata]